MVGMTMEDALGAVELLQEDDAGQVVREGKG